MHFRFSGLLDTHPELLKKKLYMLFKVVSYVLYYKLLMELMDKCIRKKTGKLQNNLTLQRNRATCRTLNTLFWHGMPEAKTIKAAKYCWLTWCICKFVIHWQRFAPITGNDHSKTIHVPWNAFKEVLWKSSFISLRCLIIIHCKFLV